MATNEIKFFWNGIKVNGGNLEKCIYMLHDDESITVSANDYGCGNLPHDIFAVENDSDLYTDYFDDDHTVVYPSHPLYKFVRYAWYKCQVHDLRTSIKYYTKHNSKAQVASCEAKLAELPAVKNPGHPTSEDLQKVFAMNAEAESKRLAEEHEKQLQEREAYLAKRNGGNAFIHKTAEENPIVEGQPVVTINWSEHPAFYEWEDGELKLSVAAAEIILDQFDRESSRENHGYDKTSFRIDFVNDDGEQDSYEGRYDLGDNDGGLIAHIRSFGQYYIDHSSTVYGEDEARQIVAIADMLDRYTRKAQIISIDVHPRLKAVIEKRKAAQEHIDTQLAMLTDEQIIHAIKMLDSSDKEQLNIARFFIQELSRRDEDKALEVFKGWYRGA